MIGADAPGPLFVPGLLLVGLSTVLFAASRFFPSRLDTGTAVLEPPPNLRLRPPEAGMLALAARTALPAEREPGPQTTDAPAQPAGAIAVVPSIRWPERFDDRCVGLSLAERRVLVEGLARVGDVWCAEILAAAYGEDDVLRLPILDAIAQCSGEIVPTLEAALLSPSPAERYVAVDAASRRGIIGVLERGVADADTTVALAAAYGLLRANRRDLADRLVGGRNDADAHEVWHILAVLA